jgi:phage terminase small subunit
LPLSERKQRFVDAYLSDPCAEHAAKSAGYSADYGRKLLRQNDVAALLKERADALADERIATPKEVLMLLTSIMRRDDSMCDFEVVKTKTRLTAGRARQKDHRGYRGPGGREAPALPAGSDEGRRRPYRPLGQVLPSAQGGR